MRAIVGQQVILNEPFSWVHSTMRPFIFLKFSLLLFIVHLFYVFSMCFLIFCQSFFLALSKIHKNYLFSHIFHAFKCFSVNLYSPFLYQLVQHEIKAHKDLLLLFIQSALFFIYFALYFISCKCFPNISMWIYLGLRASRMKCSFLIKFNFLLNFTIFLPINCQNINSSTSLWSRCGIFQAHFGSNFLSAFKKFFHLNFNENLHPSKPTFFVYVSICLWLKSCKIHKLFCPFFTFSWMQKARSMAANLFFSLMLISP